MPLAEARRARSSEIEQKGAKGAKGTVKEHCRLRPADQAATGEHGRADANGFAPAHPCSPVGSVHAAGGMR